MKGLTFQGPQDVRVEDVDEPSLVEPTDALVRVTMAGICGSDLHIFNAGAAFGFPEVSVSSANAIRYTDRRATSSGMSAARSSAFCSVTDQACCSSAVFFGSL